jgi:hypothetical protein
MVKTVETCPWLTGRPLAMGLRLRPFRWILAALLLGGGLGAPPAHAAAVEVRLIDAASGEPTTAMVCIRSLDDGLVRLPPDGRVLERVGTTREFFDGIERDPIARGQIGPVRKMNGRGNNKDRSTVYRLRPSIPWWEDPVLFQTPGEFSIELPPGRYRLAASRGMEHVPVSEEFVVRAGEDQRREVRLARWVDLPKEGWWSGDVHVHHPTVEAAQRRFLLGYAEAEDLHVVNVLEMGHHEGTEFKQGDFGPASRHRRGDYWLVSGQEDPRSAFGHVIGLNLRKLARDVPTYDFYDLAFARIRAQKGAVVGFAHFSWRGCALPRGFPWYVTTEALDFVELLQFGLLNGPDYYAYLDLGFRFAAAAGSDVPWGSTIGECRTFVHTGPSLDLDAWFEGLRAGRTYVSNGPALDFQVDGQLPGAELLPQQGQELQVKARARSHARIGRLEKLEVIGSGGKVLAVAKPAGEVRGPHALTLEFKLPVTQSQWLVAAARCENEAVAHTSPVYVVVNGRPTWNPERGPELIDVQLAAMAKIEQNFVGKQDARSRGVLERLERARAFYARLRAAMKQSQGD